MPAPAPGPLRLRRKRRSPGSGPGLRLRRCRSGSRPWRPRLRPRRAPWRLRGVPARRPDCGSPPGAPAAAGAGPASGRPCQPGRCGPQPVGLAAPSGPLRAPCGGGGPLGLSVGRCAHLVPPRAPPALPPPCGRGWPLRAPGPPPSRGRLSGPDGPLVSSAAPGSGVFPRREKSP